MKVKLKTNAAEVAQGVKEFPAEMLSTVARAMFEQNNETGGYIQREKLRGGPPYLHVRDARLWGSVVAPTPRIAGQTVRTSLGSNVVYAGVHEYGFKGTVQVAAFSRQIPPNRFGRGGTERVRGHSRRMNFKARHMFQDGVEETLQDYADKISAAIVKAWG